MRALVSSEYLKTVLHQSFVEDSTFEIDFEDRETWKFICIGGNTIEFNVSPYGDQTDIGVFKLDFKDNWLKIWQFLKDNRVPEQPLIIEVEIKEEGVLTVRLENIRMKF